MVRIDLSDEQAAVLSDLLRITVSDLGMEIAATERLEFRDQLKHRRRLLSEVLDSLHHAHPQAA